MKNLLGMICHVETDYNLHVRVLGYKHLHELPPEVSKCKQTFLHNFTGTWNRLSYTRYFVSIVPIFTGKLIIKNKL